jgi:hypothetical protein
VNAKLTPAMLILALLLATLLGPIDLLAGVKDHPEVLQQRSFWLEVAGATIAAFALGVKAIVAIVATAIGLPLIRANAPKVEGGGEPSP